MTNLPLIKTVAGAVICGTATTAAIAFYPSRGMMAVWLALVAIVCGFVLAAMPVKGRAK